MADEAKIPEQEKKGEDSQKHQNERATPTHKPGDPDQYSPATPGMPGDPLKPVLPVQPSHITQPEANPTFKNPVPARQGVPNKPTVGPSTVNRKK
jgi:hypothetical protein